MPSNQILRVAAVILAIAPLPGCERTHPAQMTPPPLEFAGGWGERGEGAGQLTHPEGIATDLAGKVYLADGATHFVHKFDLDGTPLFTFADARLKAPVGIAVDRGGAIYIADSGANRVRIYYPEGDQLFDLRGGPGAPFKDPLGVAVDDDGDIFVLEAGASRIQKFNSRGRFLKAWGREGSSPGEFSFPAALAVGPDGFLYVADTGNGRIEKFSRDGDFVAAWGGSGPQPEQLQAPTGIAVSEKYVFLADPGTRRLSVWSLEGKHMLDYDLRSQLAAEPEPSAKSAPPSASARREGSAAELVPAPLGLALAKRDRLVVLDAAGSRILLFRLHL